MEIHQLLVSASPGDAVTDAAFGFRKLLRQVGPSDVFARYIGEISKAVNAINDKWDAKKLYDALHEQARQRTAIADAQLDEEGRMIKKDEHPLVPPQIVVVVGAATADVVRAGSAGVP